MGGDMAKFYKSSMEAIEDFKDGISIMIGGLDYVVFQKIF
jgi:acyl CoA:acetate/3-ketoacid CoA transferase alpha subunit